MADDIKNTGDTAQTPIIDPDKIAGTTNAQPTKQPEKTKSPENEGTMGPQTELEELAAKARERQRLKQLEQGQIPPEENAAQPLKAAQTPAADEQNNQKSQSRFVAVDPKHLRVLETHPKWGSAFLDEQLANTLDQGEIKKTMTGGINFKLNNGHTVMWRENHGYIPQTEGKPGRPGIELIRIKTGGKLSKKFDETDAKAIISISKMRGWKAINVHGNAEQKGLMWIEAQRQGLAVSNFSPPPELAEKWAIEKKQMEADKYLVGANNAKDGIPVPTEEDKKGGPETAAKKEEPKKKATTPKQKGSRIQSSSGKTKASAKTGPNAVGPLAGETTEQYFSRKIHNAKTDSEKEGFRALAAALNKGDLNIDDVQMTKVLRDDLSGASIAQEVSIAKRVMTGLGADVNDSIIDRSLNITAAKAAAKAEAKAPHHAADLKKAAIKTAKL